MVPLRLFTTPLFLWWERTYVHQDILFFTQVKICPELRLKSWTGYIKFAAKFVTPWRKHRGPYKSLSFWNVDLKFRSRPVHLTHSYRILLLLKLTNNQNQDKNLHRKSFLVFVYLRFTLEMLVVNWYFYQLVGCFNTVYLCISNFALKIIAVLSL